MSILSACMSVYHEGMPGTLRGQKRDIDLWKLELGMVVSHHVGVGNRIQDLGKSSQYS